jgi:hypothetical protein
VYVIENLKKAVKQAIGATKRSPATVQAALRQRKPQISLFEDDGVVPNNPKLPFIHYRSAVRLTKCRGPRGSI